MTTVNRILSTLTLTPLLMLAAHADEATPPANVLFMDSVMFDNKLAGEMEKKNDKIEISVTGKVSINQMPPRLDRWLTRVSERGDVSVKPVEPVVAPTKSIFLLAPLFSIFNNGKDTWGKMSAERALARSEDYNATVYCETAPDGEMTIKKVVLTRKSDANK